jgi:hypothetical protein
VLCDGTASACALYIDAGVRNLRLRACDGDGSLLYDDTLPSNRDPRELFANYRIGKRFSGDADVPVFITGRLASTVRDTLGYGKVILPAALSWSTARDLIGEPKNAALDSLAMLDLSASGFLLVGIDRSGALKNDLLLLNPRCGAGSGINLDRVLQKLALSREEVDPLLADYLSDAGREQREALSVRADRCGVFASSATISDKNQGIPVATALATTLKSEVMKACKRLPEGFDKVYLTGRIFRWQYARACAEDQLRPSGVREIAFDPENNAALDSLRRLAERIGADRLAQPDTRLIRQTRAEEYPSFTKLKRRYEASGHYLRLEDTPLPPLSAGQLHDHRSLRGAPARQPVKPGAAQP